eukprot:TRINITY_DN18978_c0_g1_i2.p1 TRINITY_DN18978_c0_g1~~TRINITY_DN18978_c0_g1_i2.p1  ORF type:complete len:571 (-),score=128.99 TRINITY_DN18978_c0_g1_i2:240-1871(-)
MGGSHSASAEGTAAGKKPGYDPPERKGGGASAASPGGASGSRPPTSPASASAATQEADEVRVLRAEVQRLFKKIKDLEETLFVERCHLAKKKGSAEPKREDVIKKRVEPDLSKMVLKDLQKTHAETEQIFQALQEQEDALQRENLSFSSFRKTGTGSVISPSALPSATTMSNDEERKAVDDPAMLLGLEADYGLKWDRRWQSVPAGPRDENHRRTVREGTKKKLAEMLGLKYFGQSPASARKMPPVVDSTHLFLYPSVGAAAPGGCNLLGRYDVCCVRTCTDFDQHWSFVKGHRNDFWVAHAAALNVGESMEAPDFPDFCRLANNGNASGKLDEEMYYEGMGLIMQNVMYACSSLKCEHLIFFPFGMGAFLRHLGQIDANFLADEEQQRLRRRLARRFVEVMTKCAMPKLKVHICLQFSQIEAQRNGDAFLRAVIDAEAAALRDRITIWPEGDCLQLAHELALESPNVMLVNGANRQLMGNHWFMGRAKMAIDENLHRRSWRLAALSYVLNGFDGTDRTDRRPDELRKNVEHCHGRVHEVNAQ